MANIERKTQQSIKMDDGKCIQNLKIVRIPNHLALIIDGTEISRTLQNKFLGITLH